MNVQLLEFRDLSLPYKESSSKQALPLTRWVTLDKFLILLNFSFLIFKMWRVTRPISQVGGRAG